LAAASLELRIGIASGRGLDLIPSVAWASIAIGLGIADHLGRIPHPGFRLAGPSVDTQLGYGSVILGA
jgi:hypothetical protein